MNAPSLAALLLALAATACFAQSESITAVVDADTVRIINTGAHENCASRLAVRMERRGSQLVMTECDTITEKMRCMCTYTIVGQASGIPAGTWEAVVLRQERTVFGYPADTLREIGRTMFTIAAGGSGMLLVKAAQSPCDQTTVVEPSAASPTLVTSFDAWPQPAAGTATLRFVLSRPVAVRIDVCDITGRRVATPVDAVYTAGMHESGPIALLSEGPWLCILTAGTEVRCVRVLVNR